MGLDWICLPKQKEPEVDTKFIESRMDKLRVLLHDKFVHFCEERGEDIPLNWPNELSNEFNKFEFVIKIREEMERLQETLDEHFISPA